MTRSATTTQAWGPPSWWRISTQGDPWVYGVLVNNVWSVGSTGNPFNGDAPKYNNGLVQIFLNYNFESGAYLTSSPIITVNWEARGSQLWTVPMGGGVGKAFQDRQTAGEHANRCVLQRGAARFFE